MKSKRTKGTQDSKLHVLANSTSENPPDWRNIVHSPAVKRVVAILSYISGRNIVPVAVDPSTYTILPNHKTTPKKRKSRSGKSKIIPERKLPTSADQDRETQRK